MRKGAGSLNLFELQNEHREWLAHNFPDQQKHDALLGLVEEVGELAHAHLKNSQGIRGTSAEHLEAMSDAIGDIVIYLASYCNTNGFDLEGCVVNAWFEVKQRDWQKHPKTGVPE
jgi:NTP pyrophosphatase (non-canonical NTP hydrolase)